MQISDAVDNGHNKKAVQIADKILKKTGDLHCAKVGETKGCVEITLFSRGGREGWEVGVSRKPSLRGEDP